MRSQFEQRAREPVAQCLIRRLIVPRIYFGAAWPKDFGEVFDVIAIDRDGQGDAHIVQVRDRASEALEEVSALMGASAPFRWIAFRKGTEDDASALALISRERLCPQRTAGRVGVIEVVEMTGGDLGANVIVTPERFPGAFYDLSTAFSGSHQADIQY